MRLVQEYTADIEHRFRYATIAVILLFFVVVGRLYYLQIIRGNFYRFFSTENSIKAIKVPAVRGMVFDRRGQVLVDNRPSFNLVVVPQYVVSPERMLSSIERLLNMDPEELQALWEKRRLQASYQPLPLKKDITADEVALIRAHKGPWADPADPYDLRGVDVEVAYQRTYPESDIATHLMGYVKEIDPARLAEAKKKDPGRYRAGDMVGIGGIEELWDQTLRGQDGYEEHIVDAVGREVDYEGIAQQLTHQPSVAGHSLVLTVDRDLQELAREQFAGRKGAAVVLDPRTGAVRALYSSPSYDLNRLSGPDGAAYWNELASSKEKPLLNRAIQGGYPPGSTYKIVTAIAALSEGEVRPDERVSCGGALMYGGRAYHCWGSHGPIEIHRAIVSSCDVFFYQMGLRLGVDRLAKYANLLGPGHKTGIPLPGEKPGFIPTAEWKEKKLGIPWQKGENISISVGQGYNVLTPIQNALVAAHVANGGKVIDLHLVDAAFDVNGNEVYRWKPPEEEKRLPIDPKVLQIVKDGMAGVVAEPGGTGHRLSLLPVSIGGKTGTAQVVQLDGNAVCRSEICRDHAWFIGFSPVENPEVAAAVVVEHGGWGASAAAPVVGALLQRYHDIEYGTGAEPIPTPEQSEATAAEAADGASQPEVVAGPGVEPEPQPQPQPEPQPQVQPQAQPEPQPQAQPEPQPQAQPEPQPQPEVLPPVRSDEPPAKDAVAEPPESKRPSRLKGWQRPANP